MTQAIDSIPVAVAIIGSAGTCLAAGISNTAI